MGDGSSGSVHTAPSVLTTDRLPRTTDSMSPFGLSVLSLPVYGARAKRKFDVDVLKTPKAEAGYVMPPEVTVAASGSSER